MQLDKFSKSDLVKHLICGRFPYLVHPDLLLEMNGGVPDDVGSHQAPGPLGPPQDEVQHLVVLVQVADSLGRGRHQRGQGMGTDALHYQQK